MYHLDIPKTRQYDNGKIEVIARSSVGEARTETTLAVKPRSDDYRGVLKTSPRRKYKYITHISITREMISDCLFYYKLNKYLCSIYVINNYRSV